MTDDERRMPDRTRVPHYKVLKPPPGEDAMRISVMAFARGYPGRDIHLGEWICSEPGYAAACEEAEAALDRWMKGGELHP